ncbi:hypothetical protein ACIOGT_10210 [Streptomyces microflavus]|uniref:hypothetical protein n=1 Tax=Streptomyces microflavus TaxID=1919 RepID=UPI0038054C83
MINDKPGTTMTVRDLPPVSQLTEQQQRGWHCARCRAPLSPGSDIDVGEKRVTPAEGAAYSWFPRACADSAACRVRESETPS